MKKGGHEFVRNDRIGYVCTCPTNLGTVVRCSVHIQLKGLEHDERLDSICQGLGLDKRGTGGEMSATVDSVFDISNTHRIGKSEVSLVASFGSPGLSAKQSSPTCTCYGNDL